MKETITIQAINLWADANLRIVQVLVDGVWYEAIREYNSLADHTVYANDFKNWKKVER